VSPWKMKRLLNRAGLRVVHDFPWGMDFEDYPIRKRFGMRLLSAVGLGWAAASGFWFSACCTEDWAHLRTPRKKEWL
jgi:hypothetical protein